ncbi:Set1 complex component spp1 [Staphylotrichum tortipilum]|uniref:Set1 complex component spp1 n=1 Tax=Staphylotrichum tortipilum TaxID=2831512 RepID=A0AAN6MIH5_9PEZI|nr:Set1 complex component spp1 [Staphylotrichum longicolle]
MSFSSAFFTPNVAPATRPAQPSPEPHTTGKEAPASSNSNNNSAMETGRDGHGGQSADPNHASPTVPPPAETSQRPPPKADADGAGSNHDGNDHETAGSASKMAASKKKKGTAAAVKAAPKRARPGTSGGKKPKGGGGSNSKKAKTDALSSSSTTKRPGSGAATVDGGEGGDGNSSESDNGPYCLCRGPDDHRFMIACDRCEDWFHGECIGMDKHTGENLVQKYICPNCTDGGRYATRYKKMCSLAGCRNPARIYDVARPSIFCCPDHCQVWWEQLIATLPRTKAAAAADHLTQEEFMGLLDTPSPSPSSPTPKNTWHLGKPPFESPPTFWDTPSSSSALTPEEQTLLTTSATSRYQLGEEIVLCKKMLQLIDMALKQREAAISAGKGTAKDLCGYDPRLDTVSATHQFALWLASPQGEAIFRAGRLDAVPFPSSHPPNPLDNPLNGGTPPPPPTTTGGEVTDFTNMCPKKKCKPHNGWPAILAKSVRHDMKELAAQAKELLDAERRVRDGAAGRYRRRMGERNGVVVLDADSGGGLDGKRG